jgi:hypothetical protein
MAIEVTFERDSPTISHGALSLLRSVGLDHKLVSDLLEITSRHAGYSDVTGYVERLAMHGRHMVSMGKSSYGDYPILTINHMLSPMAGISSGQCMNNVTNLIWDLSNTWLEDLQNASLPVPGLYYAWSAGHAIGLMEFGDQNPSINSSIILDPNSPRILSSLEYIGEGRKIETIYSTFKNDFALQVDNSLPLLKAPVAPEYLPGFYIGRKSHEYYVACFYMDEGTERNSILPALKVLDEQNIITAAINIESRNTDEFHSSLLATLSRFSFSIDPAFVKDPYFNRFSYPTETRAGIINGYRLTKKL